MNALMPTGALLCAMPSIAVSTLGFRKIIISDNADI